MTGTQNALNTSATGRTSQRPLSATVVCLVGCLHVPVLYSIFTSWMRRDSKGNSSSSLTRLMKRMQLSYFRSYGTLFIAVVVIGFLCLAGHYTRKSLSTDRADAHYVKVFNAQASDSYLSKLSKDSFSYLAMIDAGSSGCRAHVYRYGKLGNLHGPLYIVPQHDSKKVRFDP